MTQASLTRRFADDGFVFPIRAIAADEIAHLPGRFEPELLLLNSGFVAKPPSDRYSSSWHQDLTCWGLEPATVVPGWLAFTQSTPEKCSVREAEASAVDIVLHPGEMSIHCCRTIHGSNGTGEPRIGMTMTFIRPDVVSCKGRDMAGLVRSENRHGNFGITAADAGFDAKAVAVHSQASRMRQAAIHAANRMA